MRSETLPLRPMGVGDLLDTAFRLYRRHFWMGAAMARGVYDRCLGQPRGLVDTYRALGWRWLRLAVALALVLLVDLGVLLMFGFVPCVGLLVGLGLVIFISLSIVPCLAPVVVVEDEGVFTSLSRAFDLGRRKFGRLFGVSLLLFLLIMVAWFALFALLVFVFSFWQPEDLETVIIVSQLVELIVMLLVLPIWLCTFTLFYIDLRVRFEGFDLELMADRIAEGAPLPPVERAERPQLSVEAQGRLERAYDYEEQGEVENAVRECKAALALAPDWAEAHNLRGILLEELGRMSEAVAAYREAVCLDPDFVEARGNLFEAEAELQEAGAKDTGSEMNGSQVERKPGV